MTLTEFLLARIAEDEAVAREAAELIGGEWWDKTGHGRVYAGHWVKVVEAAEGVQGVWNHHALPHIARHDPARVLAECEAKRRIVERCQPYLGRMSDAVEAEALTHVVLTALAAVYADHPDYRDDWRPS